MDTMTEAQRMGRQQAITEQFEALFAIYISKLARIDELKAQGRYGYQLRMPKVSARIAKDKLVSFCIVQHISTEGII